MIISVFIIIFVSILFFIIPMKEEMMTMSRLRNVYLYLVSFVSLMMIILGLIFTVQNIMDVIFPTNYYYETIPKTGTLTEEERTMYEESQKVAEKNRVLESKKSVAKSVAVVVIALPTFLYHWRKIEKEKKE